MCNIHRVNSGDIQRKNGFPLLSDRQSSHTFAILPRVRDGGGGYLGREATWELGSTVKKSWRLNLQEDEGCGILEV